MFSPNTFKFFENLSKNQNTLWFHANKQDYEKYVKLPMQELLMELSAEFKKSKINLKGDPKKAIFRINRDVRFSKIKAPYKTNIGASLTHDGDRHTQPVFYIHISPSESFLGVGTFMPEPQMLLDIRNKIVNNQKKFLKIIIDLEKQNIKLEEISKLVRLPRGFERLADAESKVGERILEIIKYKSFIIRLNLSKKDVESKELKNIILDFAKVSNNLMKFLKTT
jgi:uncharacterized protein (TIGR02453 family)